MYRIKIYAENLDLGTRDYPIIPRIGDRLLHPHIDRVELLVQEVLIHKCSNDRTDYAATIKTQSKEFPSMAFRHG